MAEYIAIFVFFFAVIDPIGTVPVFIAKTSYYSDEKRKRIAFKACGIAALILLFFVIAGEFILKSINIPLSAFQIAGGIVLFIFALSMIFGESKPSEELHMSSPLEIAIFPLAVPSIASPGAMLAAVLMTENASHSWLEQVITSVIMLSVLLIVLGLLLIAGKIQRFIGTGGASVISRVMGMILASVAVSSVLGGITRYFNLAPPH
ncbi:MarC family protein [Shewanella sp. SNU WT4]|uniref:MarC family protein n=1 Tax=Shewanella sp. SNU WT4 TaxID=2590015 RepID=UPI00112C98EC|nr:MarC family protein [Shewanella sp. SNU WT4]QDF67860.1 MarC family protein [Shewanella sp. SNU WT4]